MEKNSTNYEYKKEEPSLIGINLYTIISKDKIDKFLENSFKNEAMFNELNKLKNIISNIKKQNNKIYILIPNTLKNKKIKIKLEKFLIKYGLADKVVFCKNDFVGACREYRFDVVYTNEKYISFEELDEVNKNVLVMKYKNDSKLLISECLPEYTQVILLKNSNSKNINIYNIESYYELSNAIEEAKENIKKRRNKIYESYEYIPKTGLVSIDKEYKKYWMASKFENNKIDEVTQKYSRFDFVKYHNRFNEEEEIIYIPSDKLEIKISKYKRNKLVENACHSFLELGLKKGDVVTVCAPDSISEYILSMALNHIGAIVNPIHPLATNEKLERYFKTTHPKYFIYFNLELKPEDKDKPVDLDRLIEKYNISKAIELSPLDLANPLIQRMYNFGINKKIKHNKYMSRFNLNNKNKKISFNKFMKLGKDNKQDINIKHLPSDTAYYYSTGGTTSGKPSIVDLPYSMINLSYYNSYGINVEKGDAVFINYPRYIAFSDENCTHLPDSAGMKMIMTPFEYPENFAQIIEKYKIKVLQMAPQFYEMMLEDEKKGSFDGIDLSSIKYIVAGGDKMDNVLKRKIIEFFARHNNPYVQIIIGYGCTEVAGSSMVQLFDTNANINEGNIGIPLPVFDVKLIDEDNNEVVDKNQKGRLLVGGTGYVMNGYLGDDEATKKVLFEDNNNNKWYDTADIVEFVPDINLNESIKNATVNFVTREKRFIMITNANCSGKAIPDDIEKLIVNNVSGVKQCCVVGIKENDEMLLKAAVTLEDGYLFTDEMIDKIKLISASKDILNTISEVICIDKMPLTDRQKIKYIEVENMFKSKDCYNEKNKVKKL